jgi:hypothetical protein
MSYNDTTHLRDIGAHESIRWEEITAEPAAGVDSSAVPLPTEEEREEE